MATNEQIEAFAQEAARHGDIATVTTCIKALKGDPIARKAIEMTLAIVAEPIARCAETDAGVCDAHARGAHPDGPCEVS